MSKPKSKGGIFHVRNAWRYSMQGIRAVWQREESFRLEVFVYGPFVPLAFFVGSSPSHIALLIAVVLFVYGAELLNSAVEAAVDLSFDEPHPLAGFAKDAGTGASFMFQAAFALVWVAALYEKFSPFVLGLF